MHVVSGKLRKAPFIKDNCGPDSQSKMYAIELSEMTQDYKTQEKSYTNYRAILFAKTQAAKQFYDNATAQDSFVVLTCEKLKVESRDHEGKTYITLSMENAKLEGANFTESAPQQGGWGQPSPSPQQQQRQAQQPQNNGYAAARNATQQPAYNEQPMDFDSDIPF